MGEERNRMRVQLTDRFCAAAKSAQPQTDYFDETVSGLALRVTSRGTKAWTLHYGLPRRRVTLGRYPQMSLARARTAAIEVREGRTAGTVAALAETYLRHIHDLRSAKEIERRLRRDVLPIIGHISIGDLHRRDVTRVIDGKSDAPISARRVFEDIRAMVRWAVARGDLDHNPVDGMKPPSNGKPRTRVLGDNEIRQLWRSLDQISIAVSGAIKLCLVTGQRIGEVTGITPNEIDLGRKLWTIPASRTKNGFEHNVPLSEMALAIIAAQSNERITVDHVGDVIRHRLQSAERWTAHDIRRTVLTKMAELGVAPIILGHVANHRTTTKAGITLATYVQHQYEKEKREALALWADRLEAIIAGGAAKVIAMRSSG
jgi:integrase